MKTSFILLLTGLAYTAPAQTPRLVVPLGNTLSVSAVAFSPACPDDLAGGKYVLTGEKLWDLHGHEIQTFSSNGSGVNGVAFSPDGKMVLTANGDSTAKLWHLDGKLIRTFSGHENRVNSVAFSPDGKNVLTGSMDYTAKLWGLNGTLIKTFKGHEEQVTSVAFSPDGKMVLTGSGDATAKLWNLNGLVIKTFKGHDSFVSDVAFSPEGKLVLTGSGDNTAKLWNLNGLAIKTFKGHGSYVNAVAFSPDGKMVLTGSWDMTAKLWDLNGRTITTFSGHDNSVESVGFSPDGKMVLTAGVDMPPKLWDLDGRTIKTLLGHADAIYSMAFSANGKILLPRNKDKTIKLWDINGRAIKTFSGHQDNVYDVAFSPDGKMMLTGSGDSTAILWDLNGRAIKTFPKQMEGINAVAFSPACPDDPAGGKWILTGIYDGTAKLWDLNGHVIQTFSGHRREVTSGAFSPDGKMVLTGSLDNTAILWGLDGTKIKTFKGHTSFVSDVAFSPDGKLVVTGSADNTAKLWSLDGVLIKTFSGHGDSFITSVAFSPDGKTVLTGEMDNTAKLWDLDGHPILTFSGHTDFVNAVVFSPAIPGDPAGGKIVITGSSDNTIKLWDAKSGKERATLIAIDSTDWVVTTPSGLFDASPGAMNLMHFVQGLEVIELEQLKKRYWEPGLLTQILQGKSLRDVSAFGALPLYPKIEARIAGNLLHVKLMERSGGIGKLSLFVNGNEVAGDINPDKKTALEIDLSRFNQFYLDTNTLALRVFIAEGWLKSQAYELLYVPSGSKGTGNDNAGAPASFSPGIPHLYAIVVGTSEYANATLKLRFPDQDAEAFAQALQASGVRLFPDRVHLQLLSTAAGQTLANKNNIRAAFETLKGQAKAGDILVVYFSGHGVTYGPAENSQFYYLTKDVPGADLSIPGDRKSFTVSSEELTGWLKEIPALKRVLIFDACNAGSLAKAFEAGAKEFSPSQVRAYDEMKDRTGTFILAGAAADKVSFEASEYGQGLLTYSLLQGMSGLALLDDKRVDVMKLFQHARTTVPNLAKEINKVQTPMMAFPSGIGGGTGESFSIGKVDAQAKMPPLKVVKPVYIKSVFLEETEKEDVLELGQALADYFDELTALAATAPLVYVPVDKYENGYKISGTYLIIGESVQINGILKKGATKKGSFEVKGAKKNIRELVLEVVDKVQAIVDGE